MILVDTELLVCEMKMWNVKSWFAVKKPPDNNPTAIFSSSFLVDILASFSRSFGFTSSNLIA